MSYFGLNLLFNLAVPVAQMMIIMVNDIDLSIGTFVSFCACVTATFVQETPFLGCLILRVLGIPNVALVGIAIAIAARVVLERAIAGRWVLAIGQNMRAASLSGVPVNSVRFAVYVSCAVLASIAGFLLANFSDGAALNMGAEYMLMSIAVVVIGGCSIGGGNSNVPGIWGAALFMFLVVSMLNSYGLGAGVRLIMTGVIIVAVVSLASKPVDLH